MLRRKVRADIGSGHLGALAYTLGFYRQAWKENRQRTRTLKRQVKHANWPACGKRAQARYGRQVALGRLKPENGLVIA
jgi:hypothetical protein